MPPGSLIRSRQDSRSPSHLVRAERCGISRAKPLASVPSQKYLAKKAIACFLTSVPIREAGMAWKSAVGIELDEAERCELAARTRRRKISRADAMRAAIVLLAAGGATNLAIAERLG